MASLSFLSPLLDYWRQLPQGTRDGIISGLVVAIVIGAATVFRKGLFGGLRRLRGSTAQSSTLPGLIASRTAPTPNIPRPPIAGFVARRDKDGNDILERLRVELAPEKNQLIVLWGAGGVGKTTLASEAARTLRAAFSGGVMWASAEGKQDFGLPTLLDAIADHLGRTELRQLAPDPKDSALHNALASAPSTLIVLDNFETISPEDQDKCAEWLARRASCPALITSRNEVVHARPVHILAMSLPEATEFLQKLIGQARDPRAFDGLDHQQIIQAADRIPLVLEWVMKQIDSTNQPQAVLDDLARGEGDAAKRVFDRSFDLQQVGDDGRATLLALSLFVPTASRAALAEVAGFGDDTGRLDHAVRQLAELRLIETTEGNERLSVKGLTRELAKASLLKGGRAGEFRQRFIAFFRHYAESHNRPASEDYQELEREKENLLNAMDVAFGLKDWESVTHTRYAMEEFLDVHGHWEGAIRSGQQALKAAHNSANELGVAKFAHNLAVIHQRRGQIEEARQLYHKSLEIKKRLGDERGTASTLHQLALLAQHQGEIELAERLYKESMEINRKINNRSGVAGTIHQLAILAQKQGQIDEARRLYDESLKIERRLHNENGITANLHQLGSLSQDQGQLSKAARLYNESMEIERRLGNQGGIAESLQSLGSLAQTQGKMTEAHQLYLECLEIVRKLGNQKGIAGALHSLGSLAQAHGAMSEARQLYDESLEIEKKVGNQDGIARSLHNLGTLAQEEGNRPDARRLYNESLAIKRNLFDQRGIATSLHQLGTLSLAESDLNTARDLLTESLAILTKLKAKQDIAECLETFGDLMVAQASFIEGRGLYDQALELARVVDDKFRIGSVKHSLGLLAEKQHKNVRAGQLLHEALGIFEKLGSPKVNEARQDLARVEGRYS